MLFRSDTFIRGPPSVYLLFLWTVKISERWRKTLKEKFLAFQDSNGQGEPENEEV